MLDWLAHLLRPPTPWWAPYLSIVTAFGGALLGWALGVGTRIYFEWRDARRRREAIYAELADVQTAIATRSVAARNALQEFVTHRTITALPSEVMFPIYEKWFAEIVLQFTKSERVSLNHIYQKVRDLNWKLGEQQRYWDVFGDDKVQNETNLRKTVVLMEGIFITAGMIDHMIKDLRSQKEHINVWDPKLAARMLERQQHLLDELQKMTGSAEPRESTARPDLALRPFGE